MRKRLTRSARVSLIGLDCHPLAIDETRTPVSCLTRQAIVPSGSIQPLKPPLTGKTHEPRGMHVTADNPVIQAPAGGKVGGPINSAALIARARRGTSGQLPVAVRPLLPRNDEITPRGLPSSNRRPYASGVEPTICCGPPTCRGQV